MEAHATRAETHPKVFTHIRLRYELVSPDATEQDLLRAIELSQTTYCSASIMVRRSGCQIEWEAQLLRPEDVEPAAEQSHENP
jgi:putative redox protein